MFSSLLYTKKYEGNTSDPLKTNPILFCSTKQKTPILVQYRKILIQDYSVLFQYYFVLENTSPVVQEYYKLQNTTIPVLLYTTK